MEKGTKNTILAMSLGLSISGGASLLVNEYMGNRFDKINSILGEMNIDQSQTIMNLKQTNINFEESSRRIRGLIDSLNKEQQ